MTIVNALVAARSQTLPAVNPTRQDANYALNASPAAPSAAADDITASAPPPPPNASYTALANLNASILRGGNLDIKT